MPILPLFNEQMPADLLSELEKGSASIYTVSPSYNEPLIPDISYRTLVGAAGSSQVTPGYTGQNSRRSPPQCRNHKSIQMNLAIVEKLIDTDQQLLSSLPPPGTITAATTTENSHCREPPLLRTITENHHYYKLFLELNSCRE